MATRSRSSTCVAPKIEKRKLGPRRNLLPTKRRLHSPITLRKMIVRAIIRYRDEHRAWPSARELVGTKRNRRRLGSVATVLRILGRMRDVDGGAPVRLVKRSNESYWFVTNAGFEWVGKLPLTWRTQPTRKMRRSKNYPRQQRRQKLLLTRAVHKVHERASIESGKAYPQGLPISPDYFTGLDTVG